ncbi:MAG: AAA family ATPase, partial [Bacteroidota bacterium]|nr:AAA family ATPase [Bacteroidota bacterium]
MELKYKYRDMKVHSSDEWMAESTKKYRKVFDRFETTYMRVELSFYNKLFDEEDWEASLRTKCYFVNGSARNELSNWEEKRKISKDENVVYIRHSWGKPLPGDYWKKGTYIWEGYIDEVKVGEALFYVEDLGQAAPGENLFFDFESFQLYEGDKSGSSSPTKKYVRKFNQKETRYVWGEFKFKNKANTDYFVETIFGFYDKDGLPKGSHNYVIYVAPSTAGTVYTTFASWGNDTPGSWFNDSYTLEVVFMDTLIASTSFQVGETFEEGAAEVI